MLSRPCARWVSAGAVAATVAAVVCWVSPAIAAAPVRRPTPHERLDSALAPVQRVLDELRATEAERRSVQDLLTRGESLAADAVERRQRGEHSMATSSERSIESLARVVRGRIEALRAEASSDESERRASEAESLARQARGALERATERRMAAEREAERAGREAEERSRAASAQGAATAREAATPARPATATRGRAAGARPAQGAGR